MNTPKFYTEDRRVQTHYSRFNVKETIEKTDMVRFPASCATKSNVKMTIFNERMTGWKQICKTKSDKKINAIIEQNFKQLCDIYE